MTPKDKAKELVNKYWDLTYRDEEYKPNGEARECALICVDEQIKFLKNYLPLSWSVREVMISELDKVKREINKL